jgi:hypothetical protein
MSPLCARRSERITTLLTTAPRQLNAWLVSNGWGTVAVSRIPWVRTDVVRGCHDGARRWTRETDKGVWELVEGRSERGMRS